MDAAPVADRAPQADPARHQRRRCKPAAGALEVGKVAASLGVGKLRIGVVEGDDILPKIDELRRAGWKFKNLDTGEDDIDAIRGLRGISNHGSGRAALSWRTACPDGLGSAGLI